MATIEAILTRIAFVEAEKQLLRSQLSQVRRDASPERPQRQTIVAHTKPRTRLEDERKVKMRSGLDRVSVWLSPGEEKRHGQSPLLDFFIDYDRHVAIFDRIYQYLDIKDVLSISRSCKKLSSFYQDMIPSKWNINQRLARFVNDPKEFRSRLGEADGLISGTFALLFFAQMYWLDSGLDVYVRQGSKADALIRYIGEDKNYMFDHSSIWTDDDEHRTLTKVLVFHRKGPPASPQIRFHLTRTSPLQSILTDCAFSTAHVNVITWNKAYCMFPSVTFIDRRMFFLHNPDEALGHILSKYSAHGWRSSDWIEYDQSKGCIKSGIRENIRRVGDSSTWVIPLNLRHVRAPNTPDVVIESSTFQIYPDHGPQESEHAVVGLKTFSIGAHTFTCCMLEHAYTFHRPDISWSRYLREQLSRMIKMEVLKTGNTELIAATRSPDFNTDDYRSCPLLRALPHFQRPDDWECVDHMIPKWFAAWKELREIDTEIMPPPPLSISRAKRKSTPVVEPSRITAPPPLPPPRARSMSRLPQKRVSNQQSRHELPTPPSSSASEHFPISVHQSIAQIQRPLRTSSLNNTKTARPMDPQPKLRGPRPASRPSRTSSIDRLEMQLRKQPTKIPVMLPPRQTPAAAPTLKSSKSESALLKRRLQYSKSETPLFHQTSQIPMPITTRIRLSSDTKPSPPSQPDYFSLKFRRSKVSAPPSLSLDSTPSHDLRLMPDLLTPPPDIPLPALPNARKTFLQFPADMLSLSHFRRARGRSKGHVSQKSFGSQRSSMSMYSGDTVVAELSERVQYV